MSFTITGASATDMGKAVVNISMKTIDPHLLFKGIMVGAITGGCPEIIEIVTRMFSTKVGVFCDWFYSGGKAVIMAEACDDETNKKIIREFESYFVMKFYSANQMKLSPEDL